MRKLIFAVILALAAIPGHAALLETLTLDMHGDNGLTGVTSTTVLSSSFNYEIKVSGTFEIGCINNGQLPCPTDAEWFLPSNTNIPGDTASDGTDIGVQIDNVKVDWGPYNPSRMYTFQMIGLDSTIFINYLDTFYTDNVGELEVQISSLNAVPIPAAMPLFLSALVALGLLRRRSDGSKTTASA